MTKIARIRDRETGQVVELEYHDSLGYICRACHTSGCRHVDQAYDEAEGAGPETTYQGEEDARP